MRACTPHFYSPIAVPPLLPQLYPSRSILQLYSFPFAIHPTIPCTNVPLLQPLSLFLATSPQLNITIHNLPLLTSYRNSTANRPRCSILPPLHTSTVSLPVANQLSDFTQALLPCHFSISVFIALILN